MDLAVNWQYKTTMRATGPTIVLYSPYSGEPGFASSDNHGDDAATTVYQGENGATLLVSADPDHIGNLAEDGLTQHATADSELGV